MPDHRITSDGVRTDTPTMRQFEFQTAPHWYFRPRCITVRVDLKAYMGRTADEAALDIVMSAVDALGLQRATEVRLIE